MEATTRERLTDGNIWTRGLYMLIFVVAYTIAETIVMLLALFQFVSVLVTGSVNQSLLSFGAHLTVYINQILAFQTFNSETRPYPFSEWPEATTGDTPYAPAPQSRSTVSEPPEPSVDDASSQEDAPQEDAPDDKV